MEPLGVMVNRALRGLLTRLGSGPPLPLEQIFYRLFRQGELSEEEWRTGTDAPAMLDHLHGRASARKLRLLAAACCRTAAAEVGDLPARVADLAERHAEGDVALDELRAAAGGAEVPLVRALAHPLETQAAWEAVRIRQDEGNPAAVCELIRELFGNPFRPVAVESAWLRWRDGLVRHMTQGIHDGRRFDDLPVLADALEDAGCDDADLLAHLRRPGGHALGCWALDALTGADEPAQP
jgi:hypothetical protein